MKKLLIILFAFGFTVVVNAQPKIGGGFRGGGVHGGGYSGASHYVRPHVTVVAPIYPSYGYGLGYGMGLGYGYRYSPFYDPFYSQRVVEANPSQLDLQLQDIKNDYDYQISTAKHDKTLSKDERKQKVRDLKHQKEDQIIQAKKNYYGSKENKRDDNRSENE